MNKNNQNIGIGRGEREAFVLLRSQSLSIHEKNTMRQAISLSIQKSERGGVAKPEQNILHSFVFLFRRTFAVSALSLALVISGGLGVVRAAEGALPGQSLYPVKINVNESVIGTFKRSDAARAEWERERAGRRIAEAETLAEAGKLGDKEKNEIEQHLSENRKAFEEIEGRAVSDDEFFPQHIKGETKKINIRVEHNEDKTFIHVEERSESESDEAKERANGLVDEKESREVFGGYTEQGTKIEKGKKSDSRSQTTKKSSSGSEDASKNESDKKAYPSEKIDLQGKQVLEGKSLEQISPKQEDGSAGQKD